MMVEGGKNPGKSVFCTTVYIAKGVLQTALLPNGRTILQPSTVLFSGGLRGLAVQKSATYCWQSSEPGSARQKSTVHGEPVSSAMSKRHLGARSRDEAEARWEKFKILEKAIGKKWQDEEAEKNMTESENEEENENEIMPPLVSSDGGSDTEKEHGDEKSEAEENGSTRGESKQRGIPVFLDPLLPKRGSKQQKKEGKPF